MNNYEKKFRDLIKRNADAFDHADAQPVSPAVVPGRGFSVDGNPNFVATHTLNFITAYFTLNSGSYTAIDADNLNAGLQNDLPFFIYGTNDFYSGFKKLKGQFGINSNWTYGRPGIWGKDDFSEFAFDSTVEGVLETGDLVLPFTSALPGSGTTTLALKILRCPEIGYGSLLGMLSSDMFSVNAIRFTLNDPANDLAQYAKQIQFQDLSIFGKYKTDVITPNVFKIPSQFQDGIIDIPIMGGWGDINKHKAFALMTRYNNSQFDWVMFSPRVQKLV